ncbi:hypothetical protein INR49_019776, partial [Caranx melampygus]
MQRPKPRHHHTCFTFTVWSSAPGITMATEIQGHRLQEFLIRPGSPALHQLKPKEEKIGTLTRKTIGEKNQDKVNKTILLVGERGTGKSTLVNALVNYAVG